MQLFDSRRRPLGSATPLDRGGEAEIYSLGSRLPGTPFQVAKIYHATHRTPERRRKLEIMIADPPLDPEQARGHASIAWPSELVFDQTGTFLGFVMPGIDTAATRKLVDVYNVSSYPKGLTWADLLLVARNLAVAVSALHQKGYVIGDLNESNILVAPNDLITFVDCDSMQVRDAATGQVFRCPVGKGEYSPPELQGVTFTAVDRTPESDAFALGVMICQILLLGRHPFAGGGSPRVEENIQRQDSFLFASNAQPPAGTPPPHVLPPRILDLLIRCFREGHADPRRRPGGDEWGDALDQAVRGLRTCHRSQVHRHGAHLAECPWCRYEKDYGFDPFTYRSQQRAAVPRPVSVPRPLQARMPAGQVRIQVPGQVQVQVRVQPPAASRSTRAAVGLAALALAVGLGYVLVTGSRDPVPSRSSGQAVAGSPRLRDPQRLAGTYTGLLEPPGGGRPVYSILSIRDVSNPYGGAASFRYSLNTSDNQRRDGIGQARLESGLLLLSRTEVFRVSVAGDRYVLLGDAGSQLTKERK